MKSHIPTHIYIYAKTQKKILKEKNEIQNIYKLIYYIK